MTENVKYVMTGTDEEVVFGDEIQVTLVKDFKDGRKVNRNMEFELSEDTLQYALDMGIIEEIEAEEDELIDFEDEEGCPCGFDEVIDDIILDHETLEKRVEALEEQTKVLKTLIDGLYKNKKDNGKKVNAK